MYNEGTGTLNGWEGHHMCIELEREGRGYYLCREGRDITWVCGWLVI